MRRLGGGRRARDALVTRWCRLIVMALAGLVVITFVDFERGYQYSDTQGGKLPANSGIQGKPPEVSLSAISSLSPAACTASGTSSRWRRPPPQRVAMPTLRALHGTYGI